MVEQQTLEGLLTKEDQLGRSIAKRQQQLADLNAGGDGPPMNLARADSLVSSGMLTTRIAQLEQRQLRIVQQIDVEVLPMAQEYVVALKTKERQLRRVLRVADVITEADKTHLKEEMEEFRQRPSHDLLLARGIIVFNRQKEAKIDTGIKPAVAEEPTAETPEATPIQEQITYADIEQRIIFAGGGKPAPVVRRLIETFLPRYTSEQSTIEGPDLLEAIKPDTSWGYGRKAVLGPAIYKARKALSGTNVEIRNVSSTGGAYHVKGRYFMDIGPMSELVEPPAAPPAPAEAIQLVHVETAPAAPPIEDDFWIPSLQPVLRLDRIKKLPNQVLHNMSTNTDPAILAILAEYLQSQDLYPLLNGSVHFITESKNRAVGIDGENHTEWFYRHASGHLHEWLFYRIFYPEYLQQGLFILSPLQKLALYQNAHPEKKIVPDNVFGLNPEIAGVPSPDSLIIKPLPQEDPEFLEVVSVVECKTVTNLAPDVQRYIEQQRTGYTTDNVAYHLKLTDPNHPEMPARLGRLLNRLNGGLPALPLRVSNDMTVVYAVPKGVSHLPIENIQLQEIPITTSAIAGFLRELTRALQ